MLTITADVGRATLLVSVPVCYALHMVNGAFQVVNCGTSPLGALASGAAGTLIGLRPTLWIAVIGGVSGVSGFVRLLPSLVPGYRMPSA